ncbi:hypothetical protein 20Oct199_00060 [Pseudomonas phage 20Oct199]|nr:hypothetical protein 20Oct199_00060 [Pseudomonas phage 20Oct199]
MYVHRDANGFAAVGHFDLCDVANFLDNDLHVTWTSR